MFNKATQFFADVKGELNKVTWPTRKDTGGSTAVVIGLVISVAFFLWIVDTALSALIQVLLK